MDSVARFGAVEWQWASKCGGCIGFERIESDWRQHFALPGLPTVTAAISIAAVLGLAAWLFHPRTLRAGGWRAVGTPLASIIGSGFLVSVPILRDLYGSWAVFAMIGLLAVAYLIGGAVRENIVHVEPLLASHSAGRPIASIERISELVLAFAYFVSVAYYLVLFASFLLKPFGVDDEIAVKTVVTAMLTLIGGTGLWRGFRAVEGLEIYAVSVKLAVIGGLLAGLALFVGQKLFTGFEDQTVLSGHFETARLPVLLGLLILVQGFETSRFLGDTYAPELRVRTMKIAQLLAAAIYVAFFVFMTPLLGVATADHGVAAIVDMLRPVSILLPILVLIGALASQSSAAIADTLGAGGLIRDIGRAKISIRYTYPLIALVAGIVTWETNVYSLITFASRCFALYYALQCMVATLSAARRNRPGRAIAFAALALLCIAIFVLGTPAEME